MAAAVDTSSKNRALAFLPPWTALRKAIPIAVLLLIPVAIAAWLGGIGLAVVTMLSLAIAVTQATYSRGATQSLFVIAIAVVAAIGPLTAGHDVAVAIVVLLAALLAYPGNRVSAGLLSLAPVLVVLEGLGVVRVGWVASFFAALLAGIYAVLVIRLARIRVVARPVPAALAGWHAIVLAVACGGAALIVATHDLPHGYWIVVTLAVVLRPSVSESTSMVRDRVVGTVIGSVIAVVVGEVLPQSVAWVVVALFFWLALAYTLVHRTVGVAIATTVLVVVMVAPAVSGGTWTTAGERLLWTFVGAVIAVVAGLFLRRADVAPALDDVAAAI